MKIAVYGDLKCISVSFYPQSCGQNTKELNVGEEDGGKALRQGWSGVMGATDQLSVKDRKVGGFISNHQHQHFVKYCKLRLQPCRQREVISLQRFRHTDSCRGLWAERSLFLQLSPCLCIQLALGTSQGQITFNASESAEWLVNKFISNHFGSEYRIRRIWNSKLDNS